MIRLAQESDARGCLAIYEPIVRHTALSFELVPPSSAQMRRRIGRGLRTHAWLVYERDRRIVGYAYGSAFRARPAYGWTAEATVYVHADHRGQGVGSAVYGSLLACLRVQGFRTAVGVIVLPNPPSVRLHERLGFQAVGVFPKAGFKQGRWHDTAWWAADLMPEAEQPPPLRAPGELQGTRPWRAALKAGLTHLRED